MRITKHSKLAMILIIWGSNAFLLIMLQMIEKSLKDLQISLEQETNQLEKYEKS